MFSSCQTTSCCYGSWAHHHHTASHIFTLKSKQNISQTSTCILTNSWGESLVSQATLCFRGRVALYLLYSVQTVPHSKGNNNKTDFDGCGSNTSEDPQGSQCPRHRKRPNRHEPCDAFKNVFDSTEHHSSLSSSPSPQELSRSRTARKPTKGSTSAWPQILKVCATPRQPTSTCEVGPEDATCNKNTHVSIRETPWNHHCWGAVVL